MASLVEVAFPTQGLCRLCLGRNVPRNWNGGGKRQRRDKGRIKGGERKESGKERERGRTEGGKRDRWRQDAEQQLATTCKAVPRICKCSAQPKTGLGEFSD
ncbi:hypothetical protein Q8A73_006152 [Channa argus]|nr:hypothetical protein Q8A73_006152 [Channa argus]